MYQIKIVFRNTSEQDIFLTMRNLPHKGEIFSFRSMYYRIVEVIHNLDSGETTLKVDYEVDFKL